MNFQDFHNFNVVCFVLPVCSGGFKACWGSFTTLSSRGFKACWGSFTTLSSGGFKACWGSFTTLSSRGFKAFFYYLK